MRKRRRQKPTLSEDHILLVGNDPQVMRFTRKVLESRGYGTDYAPTGTIALKRMRERLPSLLIVYGLHSASDGDGMDGEALLNHCHGDPALTAIPTVLLTWRHPEDHSEDDRRRRVEFFRGEVSGLRGVLPFPFSHLELMAMVERLLPRAV